MKRLIAAVTLTGGLIGGGVSIPLTIIAQPAYAAPSGGPWVIAKAFECHILYNPAITGTLYTNTISGTSVCFIEPPG
jgi:hypothetical protein